MNKNVLIKNKRKLLEWIGEIDRAVHEIAVTGTATASISTSGGSKSYSRIDLDKLEMIRKSYAKRVNAINHLLNGSAFGIRNVLTVRS